MRSPSVGYTSTETKRECSKGRHGSDMVFQCLALYMGKPRLGMEKQSQTLWNNCHVVVWLEMAGNILLLLNEASWPFSSQRFSCFCLPSCCGNTEITYAYYMGS